MTRFCQKSMTFWVSGESRLIPTVFLPSNENGLAPACQKNPYQFAASLVGMFAMYEPVFDLMAAAAVAKSAQVFGEAARPALSKMSLRYRMPERAGVLGDAPHAAVVGHLVPHPVDVLALLVGRAVRREVGEALRLGERGDVLHLHLRHVRDALARCERAAQLRVVLRTAGRVHELDRDLRILLREEVDLVLDVRDPGPEREGRRRVERLVDVRLGDRLLRGGPGGPGVRRASREGHRGRGRDPSQRQCCLSSREHADLSVEGRLSRAAQPGPRAPRHRAARGVSGRPPRRRRRTRGPSRFRVR